MNWQTASTWKLLAATTGECPPATGDTVLLLEDMSYAQQGDSLAGCSMDEARRCIGQLARFQASWWDSPLLDRLNWMPLKEAEAGAYQDIYAGAWRSLLEKAGSAMPQGLRLLGDRLAPEVHRIKAKLTTPPRTFVTGTTGLIIASFPQPRAPSRWLSSIGEFCGRGRGAYDAATFISEAFPPQRRREEELGLLGEYHSILVDNGVRGYLTCPPKTGPVINS